jgi:hypothetical protein
VNTSTTLDEANPNPKHHASIYYKLGELLAIRDMNIG